MFGDHIIFRTKLRQFLRLFWTSQNRKSVTFELAPGPRFALGAPGKKAQLGIFLPKPEKKSYFEAKSFRMITLTSFQLKRLERLILYHINEDNNVQAKVSASQYGFRAGVSTEAALHELVLRVEH